MSEGVSAQGSGVWDLLPGIASDCQQDSLPLGGQAEVLTPWLTVGQRLPSSSEREPETVSAR